MHICRLYLIGLHWFFNLMGLHMNDTGFLCCYLHRPVVTHMPIIFTSHSLLFARVPNMLRDVFCRTTICKPTVGKFFIPVTGNPYSALQTTLFLCSEAKVSHTNRCWSVRTVRHQNLVPKCPQSSDYNTFSSYLSAIYGRPVENTKTYLVFAWTDNHFRWISWCHLITQSNFCQQMHVQWTEKTHNGLQTALITKYGHYAKCMTRFSNYVL